MRTPQSLVPFFFGLLVMLTFAAPTRSQNSAPMLINYQGELRSPLTGGPVPDGTYDMLFRIYDMEFGGTPLWEGTYSSSSGNAVEVTNGIFSVVLGSGPGNTLSRYLFGTADRWLEVKVEAETLTPRQRLTSVAYSIVSEDSRLLEGKQASEFAEAAHTHGGEAITSGFVAEQYIPAAIARDTEIIPAVKANDGPGSGLDADLLDGVDSAGYAIAGHLHNAAAIISGALHTDRFSARDDLYAEGFLDNNMPTDILERRQADDRFVNSAGDIISGSLLVYGKVGIGVSDATTNLEVQGLTRITGFSWPSTGSGMELAYSPALHRGYIQVYDREKPSEEAWGELYLGSGNVGIGTGAPQAKLDVRGTISTGNGGIRWKVISGTFGDGPVYQFSHGLKASDIVFVGCTSETSTIYESYEPIPVLDEQIYWTSTEIRIRHRSVRNNKPYHCIIFYVE